MDSSPQPAPLDVAAAQLGLSVVAVKKRLQRGQLRGLKVDGRWTGVYLASPDGASTNGADTSTDDGPVLDGHGRAVQAAPELVAAIQAYEKLVASQQAEIAFLREQVAELVRRVPAIAEAAATPTPDTSEPAVQPQPQPQPAPSRPWWQFWSR